MKKTKLTKEEINLLKQAEDYCDNNEKSTAFMIEYMKDFAKVNHDQVLYYLENY